MAPARVAPPVADRVIGPKAGETLHRTRETPWQPTAAGPAARVARRMDAVPSPSPSVTLNRRPVASIPDERPLWPYAKTLAEQVESVNRFSPSVDWSRRCLMTIGRLSAARSYTSPDAAAALDALRSHRNECRSLADQSRDAEFRSAILRVGYALQRREEVWRQIHEIAIRSMVRYSIGDSHTDMAIVLTNLRKRLSQRRSLEWQTFFGLNERCAVTDH